METKEQKIEKIERLKKLKNKFKQDCKANKHTIYSMYVRIGYKKVRQELKELEDEI